MSDLVPRYTELQGIGSSLAANYDPQLRSITLNFSFFEFKQNFDNHDDNNNNGDDNDDDENNDDYDDEDEDLSDGLNDELRQLSHKNVLEVLEVTGNEGPKLL